MNKLTPDAIFFDRDGTLIIEEPYLNDPQKVKLEKNVGITLKEISKRQIPIIIITNQSGIGRGLIEIQNLQAIHERLAVLLDAFDTKILDFFFCPHHPTKAKAPYLKDCHCRKPKPGLIHQACSTYHLDAEKCLYVGDRLTDMQASHAAGCTSFWVQTGLAGEYHPSSMPAGTNSLTTLLDLLDYL